MVSWSEKGRVDYYFYTFNQAPIGNINITTVLLQVNVEQLTVFIPMKMAAFCKTISFFLFYFFMV